MKRNEDEEGTNDGCSDWMLTPWRLCLKGTSYFPEAIVTLAKQKPTRASACCWRIEAIWDQGRSRIQKTFGSSRRWQTRSRDCEMLTLYMLTVWKINNYFFYETIEAIFDQKWPSCCSKPEQVPYVWGTENSKCWISLNVFFCFFGPYIEMF